MNNRPLTFDGKMEAQGFGDFDGDLPSPRPMDMHPNAVEETRQGHVSIYIAKREIGGRITKLYLSGTA